MKLSFKRAPRETGLRAVGAGFYTDINLNGKKVGTISGLSAFNKGITIQIAIHEQVENCPWRWMKLKHECKTEDEAREFIKRKLTAIEAMNLHFFEERV